LSLESLLSTFAVLILSLSFHEAAHAWAADRLGDPTARQLGRLTMNPMSHIDPIGTVLFPLLAFATGLPVFGWARPVPVNTRNLRSPRQGFAVVALAGPLSNLVLATGAAILMAAFAVPTAMPGPLTAASMLTTVIVLNVLLAVFNLLPVPPLDGGNVLAGLLPEAGARAIDALRPYGFLILYALMFTGTLWQILGPAQDWVLSWYL
jgi:Zn-dependent protease